MPENRACVVEVVNRSELTLRQRAAVAQHGEFTHAPAPCILPGTSDAFALASRPGYAGMGCGGCVEYLAGRAVRFTVRFDKPFAGSDAATTELAGDAASSYEAVATTASDDATLRCRFTLERKRR